MEVNQDRVTAVDPSLSGIVSKKASDQSKKRESSFSLHDRRAAQTVVDLMSSGFRFNRHWVNYRTNFITVKFEHPSLKDHEFAEQVVKYAQDHGYQWGENADGDFLIRIPRTE